MYRFTNGTFVFSTEVTDALMAVSTLGMFDEDIYHGLADLFGESHEESVEFLE